MMHLALSLAALASAVLRTLVLTWLLRCNTRFIRRHWTTVSLRTHVFVLCNLIYLSSWLLLALTLLIEVLVEILVAQPYSPPLFRIIFCEVQGGVCVIGAAFHITLCVVGLCDPGIRYILNKWGQAQRDKWHRKLTLTLLIFCLSSITVVFGRFQGYFTNFRGDWQYTEVVRGLQDSSANLTYGLELVVCAAKRQDAGLDLASMAGELGTILGLTGICLIFRLLYEGVHQKQSSSNEDGFSGWRHSSSLRTFSSCRWIVGTLPVITTFLVFFGPTLKWLKIEDTGEFYPEVGIHLLLMLSAILVATTPHDDFQKKIEINDEVV